MPDQYDHDQLVEFATRHASALCELLPGKWQRVEDIHSQATITDGQCELELHAFDQAGKARLCLQARLPNGWSAVEGVEPPQITVAATRTSSEVAAEVTRRLLPVHAQLAAEVRTAIEAEAHRQAACKVIVDHFVQHVPGGRPDVHHPGSAASSSGPDHFGVRLRVGHNVQKTELHLRGVPVALSRTLIELIGRHFDHAEQHDTPAQRAVEQLADAITSLASAREDVPLRHLLFETALNVLLLGRISSTLLDEAVDRSRLEGLTDQLVDEFRRLARQQPDADDTTEATGTRS